MGGRACKLMFILLAVPGRADTVPGHEKERNDEHQESIIRLGRDIVLRSSRDHNLFSVSNAESHLIVRALNLSGGNLAEKRFPSREVDRIVFFGNADRAGLVNKTALPVDAFGGSGDFAFWGGSGHSRIVGGTGHNLLIAARANNFLVGNRQADVLIAGGRNNQILGTDGDDVLMGTLASDTLVGGAGNNELFEISSLGASIVPSSDAVPVVNAVYRVLSGGVLAGSLPSCSWWQQALVFCHYPGIRLRQHTELQ
jgi:hypothetical protein